MRILLQRVTEAKCRIEGEVFSQIDRGLVVLVGIGNDESDEDIAWLTHLVAKLAISTCYQDVTHSSPPHI